MSSGATSQQCLEWSSPPRIWLDILQPEICERIAHFVRCIEGSYGETGIDALSLAESSSMQRNAVLASTEYVWHESGCADVPRWAPLFVGCLRELSLDCDRTEKQAVLNLLQTPTLVKVSLPEDPDYLMALQKAANVQSLSVELLETDHAVLMNVMRALSLKQLALSCFHKSCGESLFERQGCFRDICRVFGDNCLARASPRLTDLELDCERCDASSLVTVIRGLRCLKQFATGTESSDTSLISALQSVDSVILRSDRGDTLASQVGKTITSVLVGDTAEDFSGLLRCPRLEHVSVLLVENRSDLLAQVVPHLHYLRSLELFWNDHDAGSILSPSKTSTSLLNIVSKVPRLEKLHLDGNVVENVSDSELVAVLKVLGLRLKELSLMVQVIRMDKGSPHERLATIVDAIAMYNLRIESLSLPMRIDENFPRSDTFGEDELEARVVHVVKSQLVFEHRIPGVLDSSFFDVILEVCGYLPDGMEDIASPSLEGEAQMHVE